MLRPTHPLFDAPFPAAFTVEQTPPPDNFKKWKPTVGATVPTFAIFRKGAGEKLEPGLVTGDTGFEEEPDAEMILGGINMKGPDYAAVARHGSFVQWGFHCTPDRFTDAGRRLYLNTIAYAFAHKGQVIESLRRRTVRADFEHAVTTYLGLYPKEQWRTMVARHVGGEVVPDEVFAEGPAKRKWLDERLPYLHPKDDGEDWATAYQLLVDPDVKTLGLANNSLAFLDALAARLVKDGADPLAATLIGRYVPGVGPGEFSAWLGANRAKLYFTEADGWVWRVRGTRAPSPVLRAKEAAPADDPVAVSAHVAGTMLTITLRIRDGWHTYSRKAKDGEPVRVRILPDSAFAAAGEPDFGRKDNGTLQGYVDIKVPLKRTGSGSTLTVEVTYTACNEETCRPPQSIVLSR